MSVSAVGNNFATLYMLRELYVILCHIRISVKTRSLFWDVEFLFFLEERFLDSREIFDNSCEINE